MRPHIADMLPGDIGNIIDKSLDMDAYVGIKETYSIYAVQIYQHKMISTQLCFHVGYMDRTG